MEIKKYEAATKMEKETIDMPVVVTARLLDYFLATKNSR